MFFKLVFGLFCIKKYPHTVYKKQVGVRENIMFIGSEYILLKKNSHTTTMRKQA